MKQNIPQVYQLDCPVESFDDICYNIKITKYNISLLAVFYVNSSGLALYITLYVIMSANSRLTIFVLDIATSSLTTTSLPFKLGPIILQSTKDFARYFLYPNRKEAVHCSTDEATVLRFRMMPPRPRSTAATTDSQKNKIARQRQKIQVRVFNCKIVSPSLRGQGVCSDKWDEKKYV